ncbi:MAG: WYL domain-containing protein [Xanthomonadaceae bacterium]|nr:WYL domain-containing protein [Xanthomonadaceae bacterium]
MNSSRLLSILMMLQARNGMTSVALAQALEVSERTILRDIDRLSAAGVPVWGERGRNGGYRLREGWSTQLTGLTADETQALFLAGLPGPAAELGLGAAALSSRTKVVAGLPAEWRDRASRVLERLLIDPNDWYRQQETPEFLREVVDAVWSGRRIAIRYRSWERSRSHEVEPLGVVLKGGAWYLVARSVDSTKSSKTKNAKIKMATAKIATYRIANILAFESLGPTFKRPKDFDLTAYWRESLARFEADLARSRARVALTEQGETWLANLRMKAAPVHDAAATPGWREYWVAIESVEHGARQWLSFGDQVRVMEPLELRRRTIELARGVLAVHGEE